MPGPHSIPQQASPSESDSVDVAWGLGIHILQNPPKVILSSSILTCMCLPLFLKNLVEECLCSVINWRYMQDT